MRPVRSNDDEGCGAGEHPGELGERRAAREVDPPDRRHARPDRLLARRAGHDDAPALRGEGGRVLRGPLLADGPGRHGGRRVDDDVVLAERGRGRRVHDPEPLVAGAGMTGRVRDRAHGLHLVRAAKAVAATQGRDYVLPDDIHGITSPVLAHRLLLSTEAQLARREATDIVSELVQRTRVPAAR